MVDETVTCRRESRYVRLLLGLAALLALQSVVAGGIYTWRDSDGNLHFGDRPPPTVAAESVSVKANVVEGPRATEQLERVMAERPTMTPPHRTLPVTIYSTRSCGYCKKAKAYFLAHDIVFTERDIEESNDAYDDYQRLGGGGVPLIVVGKKVLSGFSEASFSRAYGPH